MLTYSATGSTSSKCTANHVVQWLFRLFRLPRRNTFVICCTYSRILCGRQYWLWWWCEIVLYVLSVHYQNQDALCVLNSELKDVERGLWITVVTLSWPIFFEADDAVGIDIAKMLGDRVLSVIVLSEPLVLNSLCSGNVFDTGSFLYDCFGGWNSKDVYDSMDDRRFPDAFTRRRCLERGSSSWHARFIFHFLLLIPPSILLELCVDIIIIMIPCQRAYYCTVHKSTCLTSWAPPQRLFCILLYFPFRRQ